MAGGIPFAFRDPVDVPTPDEGFRMFADEDGVLSAKYPDGTSAALGGGSSLTIADVADALVAGDGIVIGYDEDAGTIEIRATASAGSGGRYGPMVNGDIPPVFYQFSDGSLVLMEYVS